MEKSHERVRGQITKNEIKDPMFSNHLNMNGACEAGIWINNSAPLLANFNQTNIIYFNPYNRTRAQ